MLKLGILDRVFPVDQLEDKTREYCEQLVAGAIKAIGNIKRAVNDGLTRPLEAGLALELDLIDELFRSSDAQEGVAALTELGPCSIRKPPIRSEIALPPARTWRSSTTTRCPRPW